MKETVDETKVWLVRAGGHGEDEAVALNVGRAIVGFVDVGDLSAFSSLEALETDLVNRDLEHRAKRAENRARQLWAFKVGIASGDTIVLPLKLQAGQLALGQASGPYEFAEVAGQKRHTRRVKWVRPEVPRATFKQDLLHSFGAFMTVCRITRHDAEARVAAVLAGHSDPGYANTQNASEQAGPEVAAGPNVIDIRQAAHDEIAEFIRSRFKSHDMARLVEAVLQADGFMTRRSVPGPDGGVDILAGRGPLGLDAPTVCVQVKATEAPADVTVFRSLQGTMSAFGATQGLLVSWSGFTQPLKIEARQHAFRIQFWDQTDVVNGVYRTYERLSGEIQAELPLQRVWSLVREDIEDPE